MRIRSAVLAALAVTIPAMAGAQAPTTDTLFARSPWGAEGGVGGGPRASLLHIGPGGTALVLSLTAFNSSTRVTQPDPFSSDVQVNRTGAGLVSLLLGARHYSGAATVRPFVEGGFSAQFGRSGDAHVWGTGVYGEIGAAYFVVPHLSVGVAEDLTVGYQHEQTGLSRANSWNVALQYPAVRLAVFF